MDVSVSRAEPSKAERIVFQRLLQQRERLYVFLAAGSLGTVFEAQQPLSQILTPFTFRAEREIEIEIEIER